MTVSNVHSVWSSASQPDSDILSDGVDSLPALQSPEQFQQKETLELWRQCLLQQIGSSRGLKRPGAAPAPSAANEMFAPVLAQEKKVKQEPLIAKYFLDKKDLSALLNAFFSVGERMFYSLRSVTLLNCRKDKAIRGGVALEVQLDENKKKVETNKQSLSCVPKIGNLYLLQPKEERGKNGYYLCRLLDFKQYSHQLKVDVEWVDAQGLKISEKVSEIVGALDYFLPWPSSVEARERIFARFIKA